LQALDDELRVMHPLHPLTSPCIPLQALDDELRALLAPHYRAALGLAELPSAAPSDAAAWEALLAAAALSCAGLTACLKERIDVWFVDAFNQLLAQLFPSAARLDGLAWAEAEEALRRHQVTGALSPQVRRRLFDEHCEHVREQAAKEAAA